MYSRSISANLMIIAATLLITSCDDPPPLDEAYSAGYDSGIADECGSQGERRQPMPSAYDDSLGDGELASAFQQGYWNARNQTKPCK